MRWMAVIVVGLVLLAPLSSVGHVVSSVAGDGILYVGGSGPGNYTSIQAALDDAGEGATIYVYPGMYNESVVLDKETRLIGRGEAGEQPVVQAVENQSALLIVADGCTIMGFTLKSQDVRSDDNPSACEIRSDGNVIENNTFMYGREAVFLNQSSHNIVTRNTIRGGWWRGIYSRYGAHNVISYNEAKHNSGDGFYLREANSTITHNTATENLHGISMTDCHSCIISFNSVYENDQYGMPIDSSVNLSFMNNVVHSHPYAGLQLMDCHDCTVTGNEIHDNGAGIRIAGTYRLPWSTSYGNVVSRNNISGSSHLGLYLEDSRENQITENNFVNKDNMYFHFFIKMDDPNPSKPLYNDINRNYWSDWSSSEPKPIEGQVEIAIWLFILDFPWRMYDENPADEPYDWS